MSSELTVWSTAKEVGTVVAAIANAYRSSRIVRKQQWAELDVKIKAFTSKTYTREVSEVIRGNIQEIAATQHFIDEQNLSGLALDMAMDQLRELGILLQRNLDLFRR